MGIGSGEAEYRCCKPAKDAPPANRVTREELNSRSYVEVIGNFRPNEFCKRLREITSEHWPTQIVFTYDSDSERASIFIPSEDYRDRNRSNVFL